MKKHPNSLSSPRHKPQKRVVGVLFDQFVDRKYDAKSGNDSVGYDWLKPNRLLIEEYFTTGFASRRLRALMKGAAKATAPANSLRKMSVFAAFGPANIVGAQSNSLAAEYPERLAITGQVESTQSFVDMMIETLAAGNFDSLSQIQNDPQMVPVAVGLIIFVLILLAIISRFLFEDRDYDNETEFVRRVMHRDVKESNKIGRERHSMAITMTILRVFAFAIFIIATFGVFAVVLNAN